MKVCLVMGRGGMTFIALQIHSTTTSTQTDKEQDDTEATSKI